MYNSRHQEVKEVYEKINITVYVKTFLLELSHHWGKRVKVNTESDALHMKMFLNNPKYTSFKSSKDLLTDVPYWNEQAVVCFPSNLGEDKGYLFYFLCNGCDERVKYLYVYNYLRSPVCRKCCRLPYRQASYQKRKSSFALRASQRLHQPLSVL